MYRAQREAREILGAALLLVFAVLGAVFVLVWGLGCAPVAPCAGFDGACTKAAPPPAAPDGTDPATFCNDGNPCTQDVDCTACEDVEDPHLGTCGGFRDPTLGQALPFWCAGLTGCQHRAEVDGMECFDGTLGTCNAGACVGAS